MDNQVVICLLDDDYDDDDGHTNAALVGSNVQENVLVKIKTAKVKSDVGTVGNEANAEDDDVEEIDAPSVHPPLFAIASHSDQNDDDDLQIVGCTNCAILPHNRQDCIHPNSRFVTEDTPDTVTTDNAKFCKLCYCYVCDKPARECEEWYLGGRGECIDDDAGNSPDDGDQTEPENMETSAYISDVIVSAPSFEATAPKISSTPTHEVTESSAANGSPAPHNESASPQNNNKEPHKNHCHATDRGPNKHLWYSMRRAIKDGRDPSIVSSSSTERSQAQNVVQMMHQYHDNYYPGMYSTSQRLHERTRRSNPPTRNKRRVRARSGSLKPGDHQQRIRAQALLEELYR
ncbi:hypothetical protein ACHAW6_006435 [Cyclotella cf. meneghiniana]